MASSKNSDKEEKDGTKSKKTKKQGMKPLKQPANKKKSNGKGPGKPKKQNPQGSKTKKDNGRMSKGRNNVVNDEAVKIESSPFDFPEVERTESTQQATNGQIVCSNSQMKTPKKREKKEAKEVGDGDIDEARACKFPINRIKRIIKSEDPGAQVSQEALLVINLATVMFLGKFSKDAFECSVRDHRKILHYKHLSSVVANDKKYEFLSDFVPEKVKAEAAIEAWKTETA